MKVGEAVMLLDLGLTSGMPSKQFVRVAELTAESPEVHCIWIGEDIDRPQDVFVKAAYTLLHTKVNVGIGVTSVFARNIVNIARATASLYEIGKHRFRLGIGVGGLQALRRMGVKVDKPVEKMREAVCKLKQIWRGESTTVESRVLRLNGYYARYGLGQDIPIYLGVRGSRLLKLAGRIADGVIISSPTEYLERTVGLVKHGLRRAHRSRRGFRIVVWLPTVLILSKEDLDIAREAAVTVLVDTPDSILECSGFNLEEVRTIRKVYNEGKMEKACSLLTRSMLEKLVLYGSPGELRRILFSLEGYSVDEAVFGPPFGVDVEEAIVRMLEAWRRET